MPATLQCPSCGKTLTVSDAAPPRLTCPRCLAKIINDRPRSMPHAARAVLPVDDQADRDSRITRAAVIAVLILLVGGAVALIPTARSAGVGPTFWIVLIVSIFGILAAVAAHHKDPAAAENIDKPMPNWLTKPHVKTHGLPFRTQLIIGFLIGGASIAMVIFGGLSSVSPLGAATLMSFVLLLSGYTRGIGVGILLGIGLAILILVGLCTAAIVVASRP
jgi:DNA-directed RNA polymerase subunit RPC12/RpoP